MISKTRIITELFNVSASESETELKIITNSGVVRDLTTDELAQVNAEYDVQIAAYNNNQYQRDRASEYPSIGDQLDALWKGGDDAAAMLEQVMAVKARYPKPE